MDDFGRLVQRLTDHGEVFLTFAGICGIIAASYRIWFSQATIIRHHEALSRTLERLSRGSWLQLMQRGVRWFLRGLTRLYGPPEAAEPRGVGRFLTVDAWKTSAWIAAYLLFALPALGAAFAVPISEHNSGRTVPWEAPAIFLGIWLFVTVVFLISYRLSGPARFGWQLDTVGGDFIRDSAHFLVKIAMPAALAGGVAGYLREGPVAIVTGAVAIIAGVGGFLFIFAHAIRKYGFIAPLAFAAQLAIIAVLLANFMMAGGAIFAGFATNEDEWAMAILMGLGAAFIVYRCFDETEELEILIALFVGLIILDAGLIYISDDARGTHNLFSFATGFVGAMLGIVIPYTLALYAAVYSNSLPDWVSIALTRHFLAKAAETVDLRLFLALLLADFALASACVVATLLIVILTFTVCGVLVSLSTSIVDLGPNYGSVATFFFGGFRAVPMLSELLAGTPLRMLSSPGPAQAGGIVALLLVAISSTSLIPSLLNAATLLGLVAARIGTSLVARPAEVLHGTLITPPGADEDERRRSFLRSSILIGVAWGAVIYAVLLPIYWLLG